ncbi:TonB-dependent receptor [Pedobacter mucosus]|uniref:TonB-dependent receptor n=1 Tax=Pedobacter mucosus TaxID=2895286 RepID=UPI001EE4D677|nr:TonB-dependent receptor [Pedobacter mucosus]UKT65701.1 TonB-dependent receptor [Pedobacter mucosus]
MTKKFTLFFNLLAIVLLLAGNVHAQSKNGSVSGSIKTSDGKPAANVSVGLKNTGKITQTDDKGNFTIKNVTPGNYIIKVSAIGVSSEEKSITVTTNQTISTSFAIAQSSSQLKDVAINGYRTPNNKPINLGKIAIAPKDLPQSVQIVNSQIITDQQALRLSDVLANVNGVAYSENRGGVSGETFVARGYSLGGNNLLKNGARTSSGGSPEVSTLESVEVLKGSAALLYGGVTGGAIINMITKKPKFEYGGEVSMRVGSYDLYKPIVDFYGPISKKLAFRIIGTTENANSFRDNVKTNRIYVNPSLLYKINENTDFLLQGDYLKSNNTPDFGIGTIANAVPNLDRGAYLNAPWAYNKTNTATTQLNFNHKFNEDWKMTVIGSFQSYNRNYYSAERPFALLANGIAARNVTRSKSKEFTYNQQINVNGKFNTGNITHTILVGVDADQARTTSLANWSYNGAAAFNYGNINLLDPSTYYGSGIEPNAVSTSSTFAPIFRMGAFVQDLISITEQFKVLAGVRWTYQKTPSTVTTANATGIKTPSATADKIDKAYSPKFGLVYEPLKTTSIYVSYANNFTSNSGTDVFLAPMRPSIIDQYEAGVKNDFLEGKLTANVTVYRIKNSNFAQTAALKADGTANADATIKEFTGKTASDGIEFDLSGTIVNGLNFLAGYSYNNYRYLSTLPVTGLIEGERVVGTVKNKANATVFYTFQDGAIKGLKLGTTLIYTGTRFGGRNQNKSGTSTGLIPLTPFTTVDFTAGYSWKKLSLLAKLANITNELNYYVHENYSVNPIPPRQFVTTVSYKF